MMESGPIFSERLPVNLQVDLHLVARAGMLETDPGHSPHIDPRQPDRGAYLEAGYVSHDNRELTLGGKEIGLLPHY